MGTANRLRVTEAVVLSSALLLQVMASATDPNRQEVAYDVSPAANQIVFSASVEGGESSIYLLSLKTLRARKLAKAAKYEVDPAFSPDGKHVVYAASSALGGPDHLYIRSLRSNRSRQITFLPTASDCCPSFSPDGSRIAFARAHFFGFSLRGNTWHNWNIYVINANGTGIRRITRDDSHVVPVPRWSSGGRRLVIASNSYGERAGDQHTKLYSVGLRRGSIPRPLAQANVTCEEFDPDYSRDGKRMLFVSDRRSRYNYEIYITTSNGSKLRRLPLHPSFYSMPRFTSDGKHVLFLEDPERCQRWELWQVDVTGKNLRRIVDSRFFDDPAHWKEPKAKAPLK